MSTSDLFGQAKKDTTRGQIVCNASKLGGNLVNCCQEEFNSSGKLIHFWCTTCEETDGVRHNCTPRIDNIGVFAEDPTPPTPPLRTPGQGALPQDGVLEQPPTQGVAPPTRGQGVLPQDEGVLQQPTDEGAAPRIVEPPPPHKCTWLCARPLH
jgi:hypothetical protein